MLQFFVFLSRYLAQVMIDFPKPIVAALKKPAQGLGAKLVSLCDLVCDEVSKYIPLIDNNYNSNNKNIFMQDNHFSYKNCYQHWSSG